MNSTSDRPTTHLSLVDSIGVVWHRIHLLLLGCAAALCLGALYFAQAIPVYESSAELLIVQKRPEIVSDVQATQIEDYVSTHTVLVKSPLIIERAIKSGNLAQLDTFDDLQDDLTMVIRDSLTVNRGSKDLGTGANSILSLAFRGPHARDCQIVVRAIVDEYRSFLDETYHDMGEATVQLISTARETLETELVELEDDYRSFRESSPLTLHGNTDTNPLKDRLATIEDTLSTLLIRKTSVETRLEAIERAKMASPERLVALISELAHHTSDNPHPSIGFGLDRDREVYALLQEKQQIQQNYGPNHPFSKAIQKQLDKTRDFFASPNATYTTVSDEGALDLAARYVEHLKQESDTLQLAENQLRQLYAKEHVAAKQILAHQLRDEAFSRNIKRTQALYDGVVEQLQGASLVKDHGGFHARIIASPRIGEKVAPRASVIGVSFLMLGTLAGLALVAIAELRDKKLRTSDEVKRVLGYPIVGHIPKFESSSTIAGSRVDNAVRAFHDPKGATAEACRAVRTSLYFSTRNSGEKIIQVTSACPGDGKSMTAANLSVVVAQSGKRVLLMDADLRRPQQHRMFGLSHSPGLSSVISQNVASKEAIQSTEIDNLSVMTCGELPTDPSEMVTSQYFADLLTQLRDQYDYVFIDTGPLLSISDPAAIAARADGTLVALELSRNNRNQSQQVKEILAALDTNVIGVILNRLSSRALSYHGYGTYGRGYEQYGDVESLHRSPGDQYSERSRKEKSNRRHNPYAYNPLDETSQTNRTRTVNEVSDPDAI